MPDICHRVGVRAPASQVYEALASREGVASWWTSDVEGESVEGASLAFGFGGPAWVTMEVEELQASRLVLWRCTAGPKEWLDTTLRFTLREEEGETVLVFTHAGWREPVEFLHHCSTKWATFLLGLKAGLEGGSARAWPNDQTISAWA